MANYTMEIRQMVDNPLIGLFTFDYDFYSDIPKDKETFEKLFIQWYYFREIGFETPERFKLKLQAKLNIVMPYYRQLAMTEWDKVRSVEQMMTSKNLKETTTHDQTIAGSNESSVAGESNQTDTNSITQQQTMNNTQNQTSSNTQNQTSSNTQNQTSSNTQSGKSSNLSDGVSQAALLDGYLTSTSSINDNGTQELTSSGTQELTSSGTQELTSSGTQELTSNGNNTSEVSTTQSSSGTNNQTLSETTTFSSVGDIGIQTPAYAITEWRKVIINLNEQIIKECEDLFMKIY